MMNWISYHVQEDSFINCRYPASCGLGTNAGQTLIAAAAGCVAKLLYAAGEYDSVNASWGGGSGAIASFGPGTWYGGHNQHGGVVGAGTYDNFAAGQGATPFRDGNDTGGVYVNPRSTISDVEWVEMYFPFLTLAKRNNPGSGGFGKHRGGMGLEVIQLVYGTKDLNVDFLPGPEGGLSKGFGLFGGYPQGQALGDSVLMVTPGEETIDKFKSEKRYPTSFDQLKSVSVNSRESPDFSLKRQLGGIRLDVPEYSIFCYSYGLGGGYGDPLDRDPARVYDDIVKEALSAEIAARVYGVVFKPKGVEIDLEKTAGAREKLRQERLRRAKKVTPQLEVKKRDPAEECKPLKRISEYLEIVEKADGNKVISCLKCGVEFCGPEDNYKKYALVNVRDPNEMKAVATTDDTLTYYREFICPGCGTLLQVEVWCPLLDSEEPLWDICVKV